MDALSAIVDLLKPRAVGTTVVHGSGRWGVRYSAFGHPGFALALKGPCWLAAEGLASITLETGDFVFFPATPAFTLARDPRVKPKATKPVPSGEPVEELYHGDASAEPSAILLGGHFAFDPINASVLLDLLPRMLHIRSSDPGIGSIAPVVELLKREALEKQAGQALVLTRLVEILLITVLRTAASGPAATGFLAGLQDPRLAAALRAIHTHTAAPWTLASLACEAGMSRSSFAERFARVVGKTPLSYLLEWRLAVAKDLLARGNMTVAETALAVGYDSASGFSTAFSRETGQSPRAFAESRKETH